MPTGNFEKTSWDWQFSQFQQQIGEWLEFQISRFDVPLPKWSGPGWSIDLSSLGKFLNALFWVLVVLFLSWVGWRLWREFNPYLYSWLSRFGNSTASQAKIPQTELSTAGWLQRSQELYRRGNYREACRCLYLAMLQRLHETNLVPHKPSRTDREYLQLLQLSLSETQPYETLITTHEQLCFGNGEVLPENYQQCRQAYQEIAQE